MRAGYLDALRGLAVVWMLIFHTCYDLTQFGFINLNFDQGFWANFPKIIIFTFMFCVGVSLNYTHANHQINWKAIKLRSFKIGLGALWISCASFILFPTHWIYFGTLHCIFFGSILGAFFVNRQRLALLLLVLILIFNFGFNYDIKWVFHFINKSTYDFVPLYPWFGIILLGILIGPKLSKNKSMREFPTPELLKSIGKNSLKIYIIHQPAILGILWVFRHMT